MASDPTEAGLAEAVERLSDLPAAYADTVNVHGKLYLEYDEQDIADIQVVLAGLERLKAELAEAKKECADWEEMQTETALQGHRIASELRQDLRQAEAALAAANEEKAALTRQLNDAMRRSERDHMADAEKVAAANERAEDVQRRAERWEGHCCCTKTGECANPDLCCVRRHAQPFLPRPKGASDAAQDEEPKSEARIWAEGKNADAAACRELLEQSAHRKDEGEKR